MKSRMSVLAAPVVAACILSGCVQPTVQDALSAAQQCERAGLPSSTAAHAECVDLITEDHDDRLARVQIAVAAIGAGASIVSLLSGLVVLSAGAALN
jgi:hypothetical protein